MRRFWALPLRRQLVIAILLLVVPVLPAAVWSGWTTFVERRQELGEQARIVAMTTAFSVNADLINQDQMAGRLASDPAVRALNLAATRALFMRVVADHAPILRLVLVAPPATEIAEERRIRRELESLQGQVIRQERLAAVGQLVSGVAHEINNPLQAILGFSELLQMQTDLPDSVKGDLDLIQKESTRACGIIRNLALFVRQQPDAAAPVRLRDVITSVAELRQRRLESERIQLHIEDRSTQQVNAVMSELQQVVLNFVVDAEQSIVTSMRLPGTIIIRTYDHDGHVVLEVEDSGPGVQAEHETKLFEPFFTTKPVGQGTGLGLSVSYGIIDSLSGQIGYRRSQVSNSIFYFELPAARERLDETA
jgi:C4-dicarboxylate-specific signal transduction histidine kinase